MIDVKETLSSAGERMEMAAMYLAEELSHIRAGRANVAILDGVRVNSYGSMVPLNQVANITTPDARTMLSALGTRRPSRISKRQLWTVAWVSLLKTMVKSCAWVFLSQLVSAVRNS